MTRDIDGSGDDRVGAPLLPQGLLWAPSVVEIDGDALVWMGVSDCEFREVSARGALDTFLRIRNADDVKHFSVRFGVLGLCPQHGLPQDHRTAPWPRWLSPIDDDTDKPCGAIGRDSVTAWLDWVRRADALIRMAAELHKGHVPNHDLWLAASRVNLPRQQHIAQYRRLVGDLVNGWLSLGDVIPVVDWGCDPEPEFRLASGLATPGRGTFGALAVQLMTTVTRSQTIAFCDGCKTPYFRTVRAPKPGQRNYCGTCHSEGRPARDRKRRQRTKPGSDSQSDSQT